VLSFVGFAPADDPRLAMIVLLDEPKNEKWGSEAAAPIFAAIGLQALSHMNVPPRGTSPVPIMRGHIVAGGGDTTTAAPLRLVSLDDGSDAARVMPALEGRSLRGAMAALAPYDVALEVEGRGVVVAQSPPPGTLMTAGMTCRLTLIGPAGTGPAGPPAASR
jgi:cell division protein FtsI (penicillin-binding protein 3)